MFLQAPVSTHASKITRFVIYRVEEIEDKLMQKVRYLDKLIDELAKAKPWKIWGPNTANHWAQFKLLKSLTAAESAKVI